MTNNFFNLLKNIFLFSSKYGFVLSIIIFIFIAKYKDEDEEYFVFKLIGFYILGSFNFTFNNSSFLPIILPVGFIYFIYFMKDKNRKNNKSKIKSAYLGFIIICISYLNTVTLNFLDYRDVYIQAPNKKLYDVSNGWSEIKNELDIYNPVELNDASINYDKNLNLKSISYTFNDTCNNKIYYIYNYKKGYKVVISPINNTNNSTYTFDDSYTNNKNLIIDSFMNIIENVKFKDSNQNKGKNTSMYSITYDSKFTQTISNVDSNNNIYIVEDENNFRYRKAKNRELPLKGTIINYACMAKQSNDKYSSIYTDFYVLNPHIENYLLKYEDVSSLKITDNYSKKTKEIVNTDDQIRFILQDMNFENWSEIETKDSLITNLDTTNSLTIFDNINTSITLYKDVNYALYEFDDEKTYFEVPDNLYSDIYIRLY